MKSLPRLPSILASLMLALVAAVIIFSPAFFSRKAELKANDAGKEVTFSQCSPCHGVNLDSFKTPGLIFRHGVHFEKSIGCVSCHREFPHRQDSTIRVSMQICYGCHGLSHSRRGLIAREDCQLCHPSGFSLVPVSHIPAWKAGLHKNDARLDPSSCQMCHKPAFCESCHRAKGVVPEEHRSVEKWRKTHGQESKAKGGCESCHAETYCQDCHRTPIPHSVVWLGRHRAESKRQGANCKTCHWQEDYCAECHHGQLEEKKLVKANCIKCHAEVGRDLLEVGVRGLAVHRAHFEMTQTEPFECWVCHRKGITKSREEWANFQLCYNCHGVYRRGRLIAKWPGEQLCYRCHQRK